MKFYLVVSLLYVFKGLGLSQSVNVTCESGKYPPDPSEDVEAQHCQIGLIYGGFLFLQFPSRAKSISLAAQKFISNTANNAAQHSEMMASGHKYKSRGKVVRMLVVVVVVLFAALWMPYRMVVVYNSFAQNKFLDLWFLLFARTMLYVNSAINPILYGVMSVRFRRAFQSYLRCCRKHSTPTRNSSSQTATEEVGIRRTILSYIRKSGRGQDSGRASSCSAYVAKQFLEAKNPLEVTRSSVRSRDHSASSCCAEKTV